MNTRARKIPSATTAVVRRISVVLLCLVGSSRAICCGTGAVIKCKNKYFGKCNSPPGTSIQFHTVGRPLTASAVYYNCISEMVDYIVTDVCANGDSPNPYCVDRSKPVDKSLLNSLVSHALNIVVNPFTGCNAFGCDCNYECLAGPVQRDLTGSCPTEGATKSIPFFGRRLASSVEGDEDSTNPSTESETTRCFSEMIEKFGTASLATKEQISAYFNCLDEDGNHLLNENDDSMQEVANASTWLMVNDLDGDGGIDPTSEFDRTLGSTVNDTVSSSFSIPLCAWAMVVCIMHIAMFF